MMRRGVLSIANLLALSFVFSWMVSAMATEYTVGDSMGWTGPPNITDGFYSDWAANKSFEGGDSLKFVWNGSHNVAIVSKEDYDNCTKVTSYFTGGTAFAYKLPSTASGMHYFICTVGSHCEGGQKLAINVTALDTSSASSMAIGALSAFISTTAVLLHMIN